MTLGILTGLLAALCQSLCYLATRHYVQKRPPGASRQLLVLGHLWMGLFSLLLLLFVWHGTLTDILHVADPLIASSLLYLAGQFSLLIALKHTEPSRVSPLLGFKIIVLAVLATTLGEPPHPGEVAHPHGLNLLQWSGVLLCCCAAVALNFSGAALKRRAIAAIAIACISYSLSDWNITILVNQVQAFTPKAIAPFYATGITYLLTALISLTFLPAYGTRDTIAWRDSIPWAASWFIAMIFLYTCFGLIGPVLGNILQSSRGLISILLGSLFVYWGHLHIEPLHGKGVFLRRLSAGILMFAAVTLYALGKAHH